MILRHEKLPRRHLAGQEKMLMCEIQLFCDFRLSHRAESEAQKQWVWNQVTHCVVAIPPLSGERVVFRGIKVSPTVLPPKITARKKQCLFPLHCKTSYFWHPSLRIVLSLQGDQEVNCVGWSILLNPAQPEPWTAQLFLGHFWNYLPKTSTDFPESQMAHTLSTLFTEFPFFTQESEVCIRA